MDIEIMHAWTQAAADLGIRVVAPFSLATETGEEVLFEAHILDFGGQKGMFVSNKDGDPRGLPQSLSALSTLRSAIIHRHSE
jgi:hypothetical protein